MCSLGRAREKTLLFPPPSNPLLAPCLVANTDPIRQAKKDLWVKVLISYPYHFQIVNHIPVN